VSTPQGTGLISFKQPLPLSIGLAPSGRLHLHPSAALAWSIRCWLAVAHNASSPCCSTTSS